MYPHWLIQSYTETAKGNTRLLLQPTSSTWLGYSPRLNTPHMGDSELALFWSICSCGPLVGGKKKRRTNSHLHMSPKTFWVDEISSFLLSFERDWKTGISVSINIEESGLEVLSELLPEYAAKSALPILIKKGHIFLHVQCKNVLLCLTTRSLNRVTKPNKILACFISILCIMPALKAGLH